MKKGRDTRISERGHPSNGSQRQHALKLPDTAHRVGREHQGRHRPAGPTAKELYFTGFKKNCRSIPKFRVRYDRFVSFEPYEDGFGIMPDAQTPKPQTFVTGDGWFVYNLSTNLAQM